MKLLHTVRSLISVDLPAPFGPIIPTRLPQAHQIQTQPCMPVNAPRQRERTTDIEQAGRTPSGVSESTVCHFQNSSGVAAHAHERTRRWEGELDGGCRKRVVRLGLGVFLNEGRQVTRVVHEFLALIVNDIGRNSVEETSGGRSQRVTVTRRIYGHTQSRD